MTNGNLDFFNQNDQKDIESINNIIKIIKKSIKKTNLDLSNLTVLTEAASGNWMFAPLIAAYSKSASIVCITKNSKYGTADQIMSNFNNLLNYLNLDNIQIHKKLTSQILQNIDIVTNSGHVRPINKKFIESLKPTCVISLMWEPWEYRKDDLDLSSCWKNKICVLGVNEDNNIMNLMKYNGDMITVLLKQNNIDLKNKKVILVAENKSVFYMLDSIKLTGASLFCISKTMSKELSQYGATVIGSDLQDSHVKPYLKNCDLIIINSAPLKNEIIGGKNGIKPSELKNISPKVMILVYFGSIDYKQSLKSGINCIPSKPKINSQLNWTLELLGPNPVIELTVLGFKAVEKLAKYRKSGLDYDSSLSKGLGEFSLDFSLEQKMFYHKT